MTIHNTLGNSTENHGVLVATVANAAALAAVTPSATQVAQQHVWLQSDTGQLWVPRSTAAGDFDVLYAENPNIEYIIHEECDGHMLANLTASGTVPGRGGFICTLSGAGAQFNAVASTATEYGVRQLKPGTTTTGQANLFKGDGSGTGIVYLVTATQLDASFRALTEQLSNGTDTYVMNIGFMNAVGTAAPTEFCGFRHLNGQANWQFICTTGGVSTTTDTGVPVTAGTSFTTAGVGVRFGISKAYGSSSVVWSCTATGGSTQSGTVSTNIPTGGLIIGCIMVSSAGTGAGRACRVDWLRSRVRLGTPRAA